MKKRKSPQDLRDRIRWLEEHYMHAKTMRDQERKIGHSSWVTTLKVRNLLAKKTPPTLQAVQDALKVIAEHDAQLDGLYAKKNEYERNFNRVQRRKAAAKRQARKG